jgi:hypothetical protein
VLFVLYPGQQLMIRLARKLQKRHPEIVVNILGEIGPMVLLPFSQDTVATASFYPSPGGYHVVQEYPVDQI